MIKTILIGICIITIIILLLFIYCSLVLSSKVDNERTNKD